ncbi:MAG TPA: hypothetical protein VFJ14_04885 [Nocardioidaceae bacterium]|nr:hypothetical protein [Nocardioidaceae bacterium]
MSDIALGRTTSGELVAEAELSADSTGAAAVVEAVVEAAKEHGASLLWVHGGDLAAAGFTATPGFVRLHAEHVLGVPTLTAPPPEAYGPLLARCHLGLWGHHYVDAETARPPPGCTVLALQDATGYVGMCRLWAGERRVDGPGVVPGSRTSERYLQLLVAACGVLGDGPVEVQTWGDTPDTIAAYESLGFEVVEHRRGWELRL